MGILSGYNEQFKTFTDVQAKAATDTSTKSGECFVYFIQATNSKFIKIGYSQNPSSRLAQLQTANFDKLVLLGTVKGDSSLEKKLHDELAAHRVAGTEWFAPHENVDKCVSRYLAKTRPPRIYFAGKVNPGKSDYRAKLFEYLVGKKMAPPMIISPENGYYEFRNGMSCIYTGPFAINWVEVGSDQDVIKKEVIAEYMQGLDIQECDSKVNVISFLSHEMQKFRHGPNTHGMALGINKELPTDWFFDASLDSQIELEARFGFPANGKSGDYDGDYSTTLAYVNSSTHGTWADNSSRRKAVLRCMEQIDRSDRVHVFIDSLDCYGTIAEVAYASSKGKRVFLFADPRIDIGDLWFMGHMPGVTMCFSHDHLDAKSFTTSEFSPIKIEP